MDDPDVDAAYNLETPEDSIRLYRDWSESYDESFAAAQGYRLPAAVAEAFAAAGGTGPVLDVGAGTGLLAARLAALGIGPVDAADISPEMLAQAEAKGLYRATHVLDLTGPLPLPDAAFNGIVSSGTFTYGHVGPEALDELLRIAAPAARFALSINAGVYETAGFAAKFAALGPTLAGFALAEAAIYGPEADPEHRDDRALIACFSKV
jgi:predicted TPR repeat methyltransferase